MSAWYIDEFERTVPSEVQASLAVAVETGYLEAAAHCKTTFREFGWKKAIGANRWFFLQESLLRLRGQYEILQPMQLHNVSRSHFFGLVRTNEIYFTMAKVETRSAKPPAAKFRQALQAPLQLSWLEKWNTLPAKGLCALLIHRPCTDDQSRPAFLMVKFMDGANGYLPESIDLHKRYLAKQTTVEQVEVRRLPLVRVRRNPQEQSS